MAALFTAMVILAAIPSVSVITVSARAASSGFIHGASTAIGIVVGDIIFILLAILGLSVMVEAMGKLFVLVKYLGAAYLIGMGIQLWRSSSNSIEVRNNMATSLLSSFLAGLLITLGDYKAILFYLVFFPAFVDLSTLSYMDTGIITVTVIIAVGGVKVSYALMANKVSLLVNNTAVVKALNRTAGTVLTGVGLYLFMIN